MLPNLKTGVTVLALNASTKHGIRVPIIPVGLNYYKGHKFRGKLAINFGPAYYAIDEFADEFKRNRWDTY